MAILHTNPREYFRRLVPPRDALLRTLEQIAEAEQVPIVGPVVGQLLYLLTAFAGARRVLELGTAIGYSAIYLARGCGSQGRVVTLENDSVMADRARSNLKKAGLEHQVTLRRGDALETMAQLQDPFDLIFLDIEKADYVRVLPDCRRLLRPFGLLVADNTAFAEADSFNRAVAADSGLAAVSLFSLLPGHAPEDDAVSLVMRLP